MKIINALLAGVSACLFAYLIGAFIGMSFNIAEWADIGRAMIGVFGGFAGLVAFGITMEVQR